MVINGKTAIFGIKEGLKPLLESQDAINPFPKFKDAADDYWNVAINGF